MLKPETNVIVPSVRKQLFHIFGCAFAAGLSIPSVWFAMRAVSVMQRINPPSWHYILTFTAVCLLCYLVSGAIVAGVKVLCHASYNWAVVAVIGSLILASVYKLRLYSGGGSVQTAEHLLALAGDVLESTVWLGMFTLAVAGAVHYVVLKISEFGSSASAANR